MLTGAGISTSSGIPDFRGPNGVWTKHPEQARLLDYPLYMSDPEIRRQSWQARLHSPVWDAHPGPAHRALVDLEHAGALRAVATQNFDGLHQAAGNSPATVLELHGSIRTCVCTGCDWSGPTPQVLARLTTDPDPHCEVCGSILKTSTIMFGEMLRPEVLDAAIDAAGECAQFWAVGTSLGVQPAASLVQVAAEHGARVVIMNAQPTPFDPYADEIVREPIQQALPALVARTLA